MTLGKPFNLDLINHLTIKVYYAIINYGSIVIGKKEREREGGKGREERKGRNTTLCIEKRAL